MNIKITMNSTYEPQPQHHSLPDLNDDQHHTGLLRRLHVQVGDDDDDNDHNNDGNYDDDDGDDSVFDDHEMVNY